MLTTIISSPIFLVLGFIFGILSPFIATWEACRRPWSRKWQTFVARSSKMSRDHENLVRHGSECIEAFECIKPCRKSGKHILLHYYKLGHSLGVLLLLFILTICKVLIFAPVWSALIFGSPPDGMENLTLDDETDKNEKENMKHLALDDDDYNTSNGNAGGNRSKAGVYGSYDDHDAYSDNSRKSTSKSKKNKKKDKKKKKKNKFYGDDEDNILQDSLDTRGSSPTPHNHKDESLPFTTHAAYDD